MDLYPCPGIKGLAVIPDAQKDSIPVFVRAGSVIPVKRPMQCSDQMKNENTEALIYPGCDASFNLYEDLGDGYGYESGEFSMTKLSWKENERAFSVETSGDARFRAGDIMARVIENKYQ
ncbi:DUF5110 domain-containing protein [Butyrivibrio sp. INlla14]|uniref:DUF5110 domain-containing protein n=1 Tax=Butyrivibrio sp. INlla14 TaxID=1520808 RepID=UPI0008761983|nr:DUF5110 domain-containing protein [Butyrivibrio sp. INlla14]SCY16735.1 alpha-D-xyloside xylohydrolase [Butyrivibrio sp. INlla14]